MLKKYNFANVTIKRYGGGCHMFYGNLDNGNWFYITDSWDYSFITKEDLSEYMYDDCFYEKCVANSVMDLDDEDHWEFRKQMLDFIVYHGHPEFEGYDDE